MKNRDAIQIEDQAKPANIMEEKGFQNPIVKRSFQNPVLLDLDEEEDSGVHLIKMAEHLVRNGSDSESSSIALSDFDETLSGSITVSDSGSRDQNPPNATGSRSSHLRILTGEICPFCLTTSIDAIDLNQKNSCEVESCEKEIYSACPLCNKYLCWTHFEKIIHVNDKSVHKRKETRFNCDSLQWGGSEHDQR